MLTFITFGEIDVYLLLFSNITTIIFLIYNISIILKTIFH